MFKNLLYLAILTTAVVASWIGFSVYHNYATSTISSDVSIRITPIQPNFDKETIEKLKSKKQIGVDLSQTRVDVTITPEVSPSAAPISTSSSQVRL